MNYILAIDQSTSGTKALLYDMKGCCIDKESLEHRQIYPKPGWVEHDLEEIWNNLLAVVKQLLSRHRDKVGLLQCVSLTNQRETITVFDRSSRRPLCNAIVWQCRRGNDICDELERQGYGKRVTELTGLRLDTYFSASKLKWLINENDEIRSNLRSGQALVGTIDTWLIHRLTSGEVFATDHTNASRTLLFDIENLRWDPWLCEIFDTPIDSLPQVRESSDHFGTTTFDGILPESIPICGVMGDSQASLFAQKCFKPGSAKVTFGSGSSVLLNIGNRFQLSKSGAVLTLAWVYEGQVTYCLEGIINFSAASISWLKDQLKLIEDSSDAETCANAVPDNGGVYLVPAFAGLSAPHWRPDARAALIGLTAHSTRNHVVRAAEESISYQLRDVLDMMNQDAAVPIVSVHADGGPTRDRFLMQFTADILGISLEVSGLPDCSSLGAAMSGMLGMGIHESLRSLTSLPRDSLTYTANLDGESVQKNLDGWQDAVNRVL